MWDPSDERVVAAQQFELENRIGRRRYDDSMLVEDEYTKKKRAMVQKLLYTDEVIKHAEMCQPTDIAFKKEVEKCGDYKATFLKQLIFLATVPSDSKDVDEVSHSENMVKKLTRLLRLDKAIMGKTVLGQQ